MKRKHGDISGSAKRQGDTACKTLLAATAMSALLMSGLPSAALAADASASTGTSGTGAFGATKLIAAANLPASFDLRDPNGDGDQSDSVVTPVKRQHPWGVCWAFSTIAACETSILSDSGTTYQQTGLDLSENQLINTVFYDGGAPESIVGSAQAGEGYHTKSSDPNAGFNLGGKPLYGATLFSAGTGLVLESEAPYKNAEGIKQCKVTFADGTEQKLYLTDDQIESYKKEHPDATVTPLNYAGNYSLNEDDYRSDLTYTNWTTDKSLWGKIYLTLQNANSLPEICNRDETSNYLSTNTDAINAVKSELCEGRAVAAAYCATGVDSTPTEDGTSLYFDYNNWAHYTWQSDASNHYITIVGYDDNYSAGNFSSNDERASKPQGNGAFLVKNSWGAAGNDFPNEGDWGIRDKDGNGTGYFWLSYYDKSIRGLMSYDFDADKSTSTANSATAYADQYDYLPGQATTVKAYSESTSSANIFTASSDFTLDALGDTVWAGNSTVHYQVYLLDDEAANPTDSTHSKQVVDFEKSFDFAGYHRVELSGVDQVQMKKGQRYAVITTQKCNDDAKYYQGAVTNLEFRGFQAKVNAGESWTGTAGAGETAWTDWRAKLDAMTEDDDDYYLAIDNFPIKAFGHKTTAVQKKANTIKAAKSKIAVKKGKTAKVAIKKARGKVTVTCSNKKVKASYKSGKLVVKGKKKGSVTVKVKAAGNASYKAGSVKVKVTVK